MKPTINSNTQVDPRYDITMYGAVFYCIMALIVSKVFTRLGPISLQMDVIYTGGVLAFIEFIQLISVGGVIGVLVGEFVRRSCLKESNVTVGNVFNKFLASFPIVIVLVVLVMWNVHG